MIHPKDWNEAKAWLDAGELESRGIDDAWQTATAIALGTHSRLETYRRKEPPRLEFFIPISHNSSTIAFRSVELCNHSFPWVKKSEIRHFREVLPLTDGQIEAIAKAAHVEIGVAWSTWDEASLSQRMARVRLVRSILKQTGQL